MTQSIKRLPNHLTTEEARNFVKVHLKGKEKQLHKAIIYLKKINKQRKLSGLKV